MELQQEKADKTVVIMAVRLREEFRLKKLLFRDIAPERFCIFMFRAPGLGYVLYRVLVAAYTLVWMAISAQDFNGPSVPGVAQAWGAYLTNWTYILMTIYFTIHAVVAVIVYTLCRGAGLQMTHRLRREDHIHFFKEVRISSRYEEIDEGSELTPTVAVEVSQSLPWYLPCVWILFNAVSVAALMVSLVFWAILVPTMKIDVINNINLQLHLVNSVLVLIEHLVTALPVRLLHVVYPIFYGLIYVLFSLFYWVDDHSHVMYNILDWNKPGPTIGFVILIGFVIIPVIHLLLYGIYRLKILLFAKCC